MLSADLPSDLPGQPVALPAGAVLVHRLDAADHVYHLRRGRVTLGLLSGDTLAHRLAMAGGPCWLDPGSGVLGLQPLMDIVTETPIEAQAVLRSDFSAMLGALPSATLTLVRDMARAHRRQTELAVNRLSKDAEARCASWLLHHAEPAADREATPTVLLRQQKRIIAAQLGIAPETLSRVLRQLRERHLISGRGRQLDLLDVDGLRDIAGI